MKKKMMTLLALTCLPHTAHTAHTAEWGGMEHKSLPGQSMYPHDELERIAHQGMPRQRSVSDLAQRFGGTKGTLRRLGKPAHLPAQQPTQPSAPQQPPAYHEWFSQSPLSPQSPHSDRSSSACSNGSRSNLLREGPDELTEQYYAHQYTHEPVAVWTSQQSNSAIRLVPGENLLAPEVQQELGKARREFAELVMLQASLAERITQSVGNCVALSQQTPPPIQKRLGESTAHADSRGRRALNDQRQQATAALAALTQAMHKANKDLTKATTK